MGGVVIFMGWGVGRVKIQKNTKLGENYPQYWLYHTAS